MQPQGFNCIEEGDLAMATLICVYKYTLFAFQGDFLLSYTSGFYQEHRVKSILYQYINAIFTSKRLF